MQRSKTREVGPLSFRASVVPSSVNEEARTVDIVWSTGAGVLRSSYWDGDFYEELSLDPKHVRMDRLTSGNTPLLDSHRSYGLDSVIGVVESARLEKGQGVATVRFAKDDEAADAVWNKVKDGICRNISIGYRTYKVEKTEEKGKVPVHRAVDWEPYEISVVPIGADAQATVREADTTNPCEFVELVEETQRMADKTPAAQPATPTPVDQAERSALTPDDVARAEAKAKVEERERCGELRRMAGALSLGEDVAQRWIDTDIGVDSARAEAINLYSEQRQKEPVEQINHGHRVAVGDDMGRVSARDGVRNALLHRSNPGQNELSEPGRLYRAMPLMEMARQYLESQGVRTLGFGKRELAGVALGLEVRSGMHSTSDFALILADVMGKSLRRSYDEAPQTFQAWARRATLPDFKDVKRTQFGEAPQLLQVREGAEFTYGTIGEGRETYALATYGRVFAVTRQTLINDDLDALSRLPMLYGRSARDLESDLVYAHFLGNPTMGDGVACFHADHGNVGTGAITIANIGAGRKFMRKQTGKDGVQRINVQAKYLLVPAALETTADQFVSTNLLADQAGNINVFAGRLETIAEPRLDDTSEAEWYLTADPGAIDTLEYAYLEGEEGVSIESRVGFEVDGLEVKARLDFGVKVIDHRGFYRSTGS